MATTYQSPGVYIEETPSGPKPIVAAPTSILAVVGTTQKGPPMEPTRVTGWAQYQRVFGDSLPTSYTAEAVYGFFANGGPAAWVVRADPSVRAEWMVRDAAGNDVFPITAASPGGWANDLRLAVTPDTEGGGGVAYMAEVTEPADTTLSDGANTIAVASTAGLRVGDEVRFSASDGAGKDGTVTAVGPASIDVDAPGADVVLPQGEAVVFGLTPNGASTLRLAQLSGIRPGDVLVAVLPDRSRIDGVVDSITRIGPGGTVTLAAGVSSEIPGAALAPRVALFSGVIDTGGANVPLGSITWADPLAPAPGEFDRFGPGFAITTASGLQGEWVAGGSNRFEFPVDAPAGEFSAEVRLAVHVFTEAATLVTPSFADLTARYSFVPDGTDLTLTSGTGGADLTLARDTGAADGWTGGDPTSDTWSAATFELPDDASKGVLVRSSRAPEDGDYVQFGAGLHRIAGTPGNPGGDIYLLSFAETTDLTGEAQTRFPLLAWQETEFSPLRFSLTVSSGGEVAERYDNLALADTHSRFYRRDEIVSDASESIRVGDFLPAAVSGDVMPAFVALTQSGSSLDAAPSDLKAAFTELERASEPAMVICPDAVRLADRQLAADVIDAMLRHAAEQRRFAIVDGPNERDDTKLKQWRELTVNSDQAAVYAPWVEMANLRGGEPQRIVQVPPSGFVAGVFARTDRERGVHKAPANEQVRGVAGLARDYTQRRQDQLNPASVNLIRAFPGRGNRIWGARTSTDDVTWRYVNVRRLFNMVETSVEQSTQWVVFEPNTASTWLRIRVSVENFLDQLWRAGAFAGTSPEQAYRVRVGLGETMTETDIDLGLVITEVAIAPAKPAEFVVFRFSHKRLSE